MEYQIRYLMDAAEVEGEAKYDAGDGNNYLRMDGGKYWIKRGTGIAKWTSKKERDKHIKRLNKAAKCAIAEAAEMAPA